MDTNGNIFTSGAATRENISNSVHDEINFDLSPKKKTKYPLFTSCFTVGYREIAMKIFFDLTLVPPVKIPMFVFLLPRLIARASQPDNNMTSFTLHFCA